MSQLCETHQTVIFPRINFLIFCGIFCLKLNSGNFSLVRTTRDYEGPSVAPRVQAALDAAMNNVEEDIDIDALAITNAFAVRGTR